MHPFMVSCLWLCLAQDPERSTPEKTLEALARADEWFQTEFPKAMGDIYEKADKLKDFCRTESLAARRKDLRDAMRKAWEEGCGPVHVRYSIVRRETTSKGEMTLEVEKETRKMEEADKADETERRRFVLEESPQGQRIRERWNPCAKCEGKSCVRCRGVQWEREDLAAKFRSLFRFFGPLKEPQCFRNLDSPADTARSYVDIDRMQLFVVTVEYRKVIEGMIARARSLYAASLVREIEEDYAKAVDEGESKFQGFHPTHGGGVVEGETARVHIFFPPFEGKRAENLERLLRLKRVGNRWLVDDDQVRCNSCAGAGACATCWGTGRFGDRGCTDCGGKGKCEGCAGAGWRELD